jgi:hypothetical protein
VSLDKPRDSVRMGALQLNSKIPLQRGGLVTAIERQCGTAARVSEEDGRGEQAAPSNLGAWKTRSQNAGTRRACMMDQTGAAVFAGKVRVAAAPRQTPEIAGSASLLITLRKSISQDFLSGQAETTGADLISLATPS